jgi:hypothetical protein
MKVRALALALLPALASAATLRPALSDRSSYGESFTFVADLDDGTYVHLTLSLTNLGPGGTKGVCRGTVVPPSGPAWKASEHFGRDAVAFTAGPPERLAIGRCSATGGGGATTAEVRLDEGTVTLAFAAAPLRRPPHDAVVVVGSDLYRNEVLLLRAPVTATLALSGRPARTVQGGGYADHSRGTVPTKELAHRWIRFRALRGPEGLLALAREGRDGSFAPAWSCRDASPDGCREYASFSVEQRGPSDAPTFAVALAGDAPALRIASTRVLLRDAPVEELGVLAPLVRPFVGSPVTYTCRARAEAASGAVDGVLELEFNAE